MESDEELFARTQAGDLAAFDRLYERYEVRLYAYLRALLGDRRDAEEIFHDAFINATRARSPAFDQGGFRAWLYRIARNLAYNRRRGTMRRDRAHAASGDVADDDDAHARAHAQPPDAAIEARELAIALDRAVHRLPPALGELYHLRASGLSYEQIASVVDAPIGTIKSRMHQMVRALREELSPWIAPE